MSIQRLFGNYPIKNKLLVMSLITSTLALIITYSAFISYDLFLIHSNLKKEIKLLSDVVGTRVDSSFSFAQEEAAIRDLQDLQAKRSVTVACVYNADNSIFAEYKRLGSKRECPSISRDPGEYVVDDHFQVYKKIADGSGTLLIESDTLDITNHLKIYSVAVVILFFLVIFIAYQLSSPFRKIISDPILRLTATAETVKKEKNYSLRAEKSYKDEVGILVNVFNDMMGEIHARDEQLKAYNTQLEKTVADRTRDLQFTVHRLEKANEDKNLWISNMTHEIRTPIHGMKSFSKFGVDALKLAIEGQKEVDLQQYANFFDRCQQAANRLNYLIEGILDLSKMNAGKMNFHYEQCSIFDVLRISHDELHHKWAPKNITVQFEPEDQPEIRLTCDKNKLIQVVTNVLGNAIKFSPQNGIIIIRVEEKTHRYFNGMVEGIDIHIKDQGPGIPPGEEEKIFDTFVQSSTTYDGSGGTGLGLSIAREIVRAHNGEIRAQNNPKGEPGCTFMFWIAKMPLSEGQETEETGEA